MKKQTFVALVCGYGVPKDIFTDQNYSSYLTSCFNTLFEKFSETTGTIVFSGGRTDLFPPYRRTEAREMKRWFTRQLAIARKESGTRLPWKFTLDTHALTSVENILNFRPYVSQQVKVIIFGEQTRAHRLRKFFRAAFPDQRFTLVPIDFDASKNRYRVDHVKKRETRALAIGLEAIKNPKVLALCRAIAKKKIRAMREHGPKSANQLPKIVEALWSESEDAYARLRES